MTYAFSCPAPCRRTIVVRACNDDEAVDKLIYAGAMSCRNRGNHDHCDSVHLVMQPLMDKQLREVVRLQMQAGSSEDGLEEELVTGDDRIISRYGSRR